jgi:patatin-related protein
MSVDMDRVPGLGAGRAEELRQALAMRGGVSLAIWMGGACQEIERLRSAADRDATADADAGVYRALLIAAGYDNVVVDVLAGTSAGGLNAVLLACSLVYGMPFDDGIRDLWLRVADIEGLSRHPRDRTPPSLLRGDGVFYAELMANLRDLLRRWEGQTEKGRRVDLILTCTLLEPEADTVYQPVGAPIRDARSRAHFRFRHFGDDPAGASDFRPPDPPDSPADPEEARWEPLRRLAYAARSTSSYPTAFEPARIRVGHGEDGSCNPEGRERFPRNMHAVFSESRSPRSQPGGTPIHPVTLIDGGVLDNIPIAWAIRSIAAAKASTTVDRWLLYLQPVPPREPLLEHQPARDADDCERRRHGTDAWFPRLVGTAKKALGIKLASESLLDDVGELRMHAVRAEQRRQLADTIAASSSSLAGLVSRAANQQALTAYRRRQGRVEAARLARLLEDPVQVTGPDPLPFGEPRHPLEPMGPDKATAFLAALHADDEASKHPPSHDLGALALPPVSRTHAQSDLFELRGELRSLQALARAVATLLDLASRLERQRLQVEHDQDGRQSRIRAGELAETTLYPLRSAIELLIAAHDRLLLRRCAQIGSGAAGRPIDLAKQAAAELVHLVETIKLADRFTERDHPLPRLCGEVARDCPVMLADDADWPSGGFDWL